MATSGDADGSAGDGARTEEEAGNAGGGSIDSRADSVREALEAGDWTLVDGSAAGDEPESAGGGGSAAEATADERGRRLYDWWSRRSWLYDALMGMAAPIREEAFEALDAEAGEAILDLGCGPGTNFERLRAGVGPEGTIVGLDYSPEMIDRAAAAVGEAGWTNVRVVRADATETCGPPATFDAAFTTFALHTMADVDAVVENVHEALRPGGRFVVSDAREIRDWPASLLNPLYERLIARAVNHRPDQDPLGALEATFESVEVVNTYDAGSGYLAVARKRPSDRPRSADGRPET